MSSPQRLFDHVVIVMFENQYRGYVLENRYFRRLASQGIELANSFGVMHPSQTNYIVSLAGELCNVSDDDAPPQLLPQRTIVDLIEEHGLEWKAYMDGYTPGLSHWTSALVPSDQYPYVIKHDPFSSFENIVRNQQRWSKITSQHQFFTDVAAGQLPNYAWFTPDMWDDGHYTRGSQTSPHERAPALVDQAAAWLEWLFGALAFPGPASLLPARTLVVVTFDEADFEADWDAGKKYTYDGPNQVYTVLLGDGIGPGVEQEGYNHYSVLKTVETNFALGSLGKNDEDANWLRFLWGERFAWGSPQTTPVAPGGAVAAAGLGDDLHVVYATGSVLHHRSWNGSEWSPEELLGASAGGPLALVAIDDGLTLVVALPGGGAAELCFRPGSGWSEPRSVVEGPVEALALTACDGGSDLMLVWSGADGVIGSRRWSGGEWQPPVESGHRTAGALALAGLGPCLLLVFQAEGGGGLTAVTYNTAAFNVVTLPESKYAGPYDDTTRDAWSPSGAPVGHFAAASSPVTPGEEEPLLRPYRGAAPLAIAGLDGVLHLVHPPENGTGLVSEIFSISGLLTPKLPVSYRASDATTTSNGYGTLAEAGWSVQTAVSGSSQEPGAALALTGRGDALVLLSQAKAGGALALTIGKYDQSSS